MKQMNTYNRVTGYLNKIFRMVNEDFFGGTLEATVTLQSSATSYGHVTVLKPWKDSEGHTYHELNISADYVAERPIEQTVATIIHEGCHLTAMLNGISDTSNRNRYHNSNFKAIAESLPGQPIHLDYDKSIGWSITTPNDSLVEWCIDKDLEEIKIGRQSELVFVGGFGTTAPTTTPTTPKVKPKGSNSRLLECPSCHMKLRATRDGLRVMCMECGEQLEYKS